MIALPPFLLTAASGIFISRLTLGGLGAPGAFPAGITALAFSPRGSAGFRPGIPDDVFIRFFLLFCFAGLNVVVNQHGKNMGNKKGAVFRIRLPPEMLQILLGNLPEIFCGKLSCRHEQPQSCFAFEAELDSHG